MDLYKGSYIQYTCIPLFLHIGNVYFIQNHHGAQTRKYFFKFTKILGKLFVRVNFKCVFNYFE